VIVNARHIKKVAKAKVRKKERAERRMARAQKESGTIIDNPDLSAAEKQRQFVMSVVRALSRIHMCTQRMHKQAAGVVTNTVVLQILSQV
jgi:hypothetical protein